MRLGLFLNFEHDPKTNPEVSAQVFRDEMDLAAEADTTGFDELWVSEHHFSSFSQSASVLPLLAHLAARTSRARLGPASILMPLHDPVRVAEDLATIDLLSNGRLNIGLARGGPFPAQNKHLRTSREEARERIVPASAFLLRLLQEEDVTETGMFQAEGLTTYPRPLQTNPPVWMASSTKETVLASAKLGYGLMAGQATPAANFGSLVEAYASATDGTEPDLVILRTAFVADSDAEAMRHALPSIERFIECMKPQFGANPPKGFSVEAFASQALIGSPETCREKLAALRAAVPIASIVIKPASLDQKARLECVKRFKQEVLSSCSLSI
jgi:alkanesulfonate monooxygenase SsuD/methylene tetrahydromethanopterin reductase-like flavin-dependent oxidoreductase (luciferase family)